MRVHVRLVLATRKSLVCGLGGYYSKSQSGSCDPQKSSLWLRTVLQQITGCEYSKHSDPCACCVRESVVTHARACQACSCDPQKPSLWLRAVLQQITRCEESKSQAASLARSRTVFFSWLREIVRTLVPAVAVSPW